MAVDVLNKMGLNVKAESGKIMSGPLITYHYLAQSEQYRVMVSGSSWLHGRSSRTEPARVVAELMRNNTINHYFYPFSIIFCN